MQLDITAELANTEANPQFEVGLALMDEFTVTSLGLYRETRMSLSLGISVE